MIAAFRVTLLLVKTGRESLSRLPNQPAYSNQEFYMYLKLKLAVNVVLVPRQARMFMAFLYVPMRSSEKERI